MSTSPSGRSARCRTTSGTRSSRSRETMSSANGALEAVEGILEQGGDADDVLRQVVAALHERGGYAWAGLFFVEEGWLTLGAEAGMPDEARRTRVPVLWQGVEVAELAVDGAPRRASRP